MCSSPEDEQTGGRGNIEGEEEEEEEDMEDAEEEEEEDDKEEEEAATEEWSRQRLRARYPSSYRFIPALYMLHAGLTSVLVGGGRCARAAGIGGQGKRAWI